MNEKAADTSPPGPPPMPDPFAHPTPEEAHKDCPPVVWDGLHWRCNNHQPPQFVSRPRQAYQAPDGIRPPRPTPLGGAPAGGHRAQEMEVLSQRAEGLQTENARLGAQLGEANAEVEKLRAELEDLRAQKRPPPKKRPKEE